MTTANRLLLYGEAARLYDIYSLDGGFFRIKYRQDRRPGLAKENPVWFHLKHWPVSFAIGGWLWFRRWQYERLTRRIWQNPDRFAYEDAAISQTAGKEFETLDLFTKTRGGMEAVGKARKIKAITAGARKRGAETASA
ncbi:hypothetical protein JM93_01256 [Roseibium hamelinense]|uniref:Uncharacterized protein n=1 Tax=Roseibium hamelinense TaxID=150831 RepID=A0A562T9E2_9HYPH|nr:hypothetical protein JM93_01256 [Roseibium hamelinense]